MLNKKSGNLVMALVFAAALFAAGASLLFAGAVSAQADQGRTYFAHHHGGGHHNYYGYGHSYCG